MSNTNGEWKVLAHGPIERLAENLWWVQGALPGMSLKRTMAVARMHDGRLVIHNGIAMQEPAMREVEAFGTPAFLIVPNGAHRLDAPAYKRRYPNLTVLAPKGARAKVAEKVQVDGTYEDLPQDDSVRLEMLHGVGDSEGAMLIRSPDGTTVVLNDAVFNTTLLGSAPGPRISRLAKLVFIKDKAALRGDLERYAAIPDLVRLVVAHEKVAQGLDARAALQKAITYL